MAGKLAIPAVPSSVAGTDRAAFDQAVRHTLAQLTGQVGGRIESLAADADLAAVVAKVNEIIARLQ